MTRFNGQSSYLAKCGQDIRLEHGAFLAVLKAGDEVTLGNAPLCAACASSE